MDLITCFRKIYALAITCKNMKFSFPCSFVPQFQIMLMQKNTAQAQLMTNASGYMINPWRCIAIILGALIWGIQENFAVEVFDLKFQHAKIGTLWRILKVIKTVWNFRFTCELYVVMYMLFPPVFQGSFSLSTALNHNKPLDTYLWRKACQLHWLLRF